MNARLWLCVGMGVFVAHLAVFMIWAQFQPRPPLKRPVENPFIVRAQGVVDPNTGEKVVVREFTVTTQLAAPVAIPPPANVELPAPAASAAE